MSPRGRSIQTWFALGALALALGFAYQGAEINPGALIANSGNIAQLGADFFPPDFSRFDRYMADMVLTVEIALWGTFLALIASVPLGFLASDRVSHGAVVFLIRRFLDGARAINEMVFALLFVVAVGLGPFAGVLALFVHTTGVLAKLFSEAVDAIDMRPVEGLRACGASKLGEIRFGIIPQVLPLWGSYLLYRFESNVRSATVLGIVGAGGIGQSLYEALRGFNYDQASAILVIIILSVMVIDNLSAAIRRLTV